MTTGATVVLAAILAVALGRVVAAGRRAKSLRDEPLKGEMGIAITSLNPEGWVEVRGRVHRASSVAPVEAGARIQVEEGGSPLVAKPFGAS